MHTCDFPGYDRVKKRLANLATIFYIMFCQPPPERHGKKLVKIEFTNAGVTEGGFVKEQ